MTETIRFHTMTDKIAAEVKRLRHGIAAKAIRQNPDLIGHALDAVARMERQHGRQPQFDEWRELLQKPLREIIREIERPTERMDRLRIDSPFFLLSEHGLDFTDEEERRTLYRAARLRAEADPSDVMTWKR